MASREKFKPVLSSIPIPPNPLSFRRQSQSYPQPNASTNSKSKASKASEEDVSHVDPDELFIRYTIPEVKGMQGKLRAEADAKQEELRQMVGERYRDLLQASTSIIAMSESSRRVMESFAGIQEAMLLERQDFKPRNALTRGKEDGHLKALQSLSAHIKLLLDGPEHLWRLLENKDYLRATWLFLLSRVVHRTLVTDDPDETAPWEKEGISVMTQFPLVQRQWDIIAQLRPQITHRATQYLRQLTASSEACSTVLTLHLLDSLPLTDIISTFLSQRTKALSSFTTRTLGVPTSSSRASSPSPKTKRRNRQSVDLSGSSRALSQSRKGALHDIRDALLEVLEMIWGSMHIAREVFGHGNGDISLVERTLADIHSDTPSETVLTTSAIMSTLPSSTHLLTLPSSILSYKPYIDLTSPSAHVEPNVLDSKLFSWFDKAMQGLEGRIQVWLTGLSSIRELWTLRRNLLDRLQDSQGLELPEKTRVQNVLNAGVRDRAVQVAGASLQELEKHLERHLDKAIQELSGNNKGSKLDTSPSSFVFSAPSIPSVTHLAASKSTETPLRQFKDALRQRVNGRTPLLDEVLSGVEAKAKNLEADLNVMNKYAESHTLRDEVMKLYNSASLESAKRIQGLLEKSMKTENETPDSNMSSIVFIGRLAYYMSRSSYIINLRYPVDALDALQKGLRELHETSLKHWRSHSISMAIKHYESALDLSSRGTPRVDFTWPSQPSYQLSNALFSIISSLDDLGLSRTELIKAGTVDAVLSGFRSAVAEHVLVKEPSWRRADVQLLWDLMLLSHLGDTLPAHDLQQKLEDLERKLQLLAPEEEWTRMKDHLSLSPQQYLSRSQTLLAPLIHPTKASPKGTENGHAAPKTSSKTKSSSLLALGVPEVEQDYRPAVEIAKPSARFGLLLVGSTAMR